MIILSRPIAVLVLLVILLWRKFIYDKLTSWMLIIRNRIYIYVSKVEYYHIQFISSIASVKTNIRNIPVYLLFTLAKVVTPTYEPATIWNHNGETDVCCFLNSDTHFQLSDTEIINKQAWPSKEESRGKEQARNAGREIQTSRRKKRDRPAGQAEKTST